MLSKAGFNLIFFIVYPWKAVYNVKITILQCCSNNVKGLFSSRWAAKN